MNTKTLLIGAATFAFTATSAMADPVSTRLDTGTAIQIRPTVDLVGTYTLTKGNELNFGVILNPVKDQTVTVTKDSYVSGTANLLAQGQLTNSAAESSTKTVHAGSLAVTGKIATLLANEGAGSVSIHFESDSTDLKSGDTLCGTVTGLNDITIVPSENPDGGTFYYGGTFKVAADGLTGLHCVGDPVTVTLIMTEATVNP